MGSRKKTGRNALEFFKQVFVHSRPISNQLGCDLAKVLANANVNVDQDIKDLSPMRHFM